MMMVNDASCSARHGAYDISSGAENDYYESRERRSIAPLVSPEMRRASARAAADIMPGAYAILPLLAMLLFCIRRGMISFAMAAIDNAAVFWHFADR